MTVAAIITDDHLALQKAFDPDHLDLAAAFSMWAEIASSALEKELALRHE